MVGAGGITHRRRLAEEFLCEASVRHEGHAEQKVDPPGHADGMTVSLYGLVLIHLHFLCKSLDERWGQRFFLVACERVVHRIVGIPHRHSRQSALYL